MATLMFPVAQTKRPDWSLFLTHHIQSIRKSCWLYLKIFPESGPFPPPPLPIALVESTIVTATILHTNSSEPILLPYSLFSEQPPKWFWENLSSNHVIPLLKTLRWLAIHSGLMPTFFVWPLRLPWTLVPSDLSDIILVLSSSHTGSFTLPLISWARTNLSSRCWFFPLLRNHPHPIYLHD